MAHPKRKHSNTRRDKKRASKKLKNPATSLCPSCHQPKMPHRICPHCGTYKTVKYVERKEKIRKS